MDDTVYLVGCCERQRHLNCNVLLPLFFRPMSDDHFCDSVRNYDYCIKLLVLIMSFDKAVCS